MTRAREGGASDPRPLLSNSPTPQPVQVPFASTAAEVIYLPAKLLLPQQLFSFFADCATSEDTSGSLFLFIIATCVLFYYTINGCPRDITFLQTIQSTHIKHYSLQVLLLLCIDDFICRSGIKYFVCFNFECSWAVISEFTNVTRRNRGANKAASHTEHTFASVGCVKV